MISLNPCITLGGRQDAPLMKERVREIKSPRSQSEPMSLWSPCSYHLVINCEHNTNVKKPHHRGGPPLFMVPYLKEWFWPFYKGLPLKQYTKYNCFVQMTLNYSSQPNTTLSGSPILKMAKKQAAKIWNVRKKPTSICWDGKKESICLVLLPVTNTQGYSVPGLTYNSCFSQVFYRTSDSGRVGEDSYLNCGGENGKGPWQQREDDLNRDVLFFCQLL